MPGIHRPLINLDDIASLIDQERCWQAEVAMTVEQIPVQNAVNSGYLIRSAENGECQPTLSRQRLQLFGAGWLVNIHSKQLKTVRLPAIKFLLKRFKISLAIGGLCSPEIQQHEFSAKCGKSLHPSSQVGKRNFWCGYWGEHPGLNGSEIDFLWFADAERRTRWRLRLERIEPQLFGSLFYPDPVVGRKVANVLQQSAWPADRRAHTAFSISQAEEDFLAVLG
jgi:hypothetical protein